MAGSLFTSRIAEAPPPIKFKLNADDMWELFRSMLIIDILLDRGEPNSLPKQRYLRRHEDMKDQECLLFSFGLKIK